LAASQELPQRRSRATKPGFKEHNYPKSLILCHNLVYHDQWQANSSDTKNEQLPRESYFILNKFSLYFVAYRKFAFGIWKFKKRDVSP